MKLIEYEASGKRSNNTVKIHSFPEKENPDFNHPINRKPFHFMGTSYMDESFIVDWQLEGE